MFTIVKFFKTNIWVTRTLGKVGKPTTAVTEGFWFVEILKETKKGKGKGIFILRPIIKLALEDIDILLPSFYSKKVIDGIAYVQPKFKTKNYILSLKIKKLIYQQDSSIYAIITLFDSCEDITLY